MTPRTRQNGFTLLEVLIAMSILAVGATSVLSIFVWAVSFHHKRVEENRIMDLWNHAYSHAGITFNEFDPDRVPEGAPGLPTKIVADLTDPTAIHMDPMIREAQEKFPGFRYEITFEDNDLAVRGSSVVVNIEIFGLSGQRDNEFSQKVLMTRNGAPISERFKTPSLSEADKSSQHSGLDTERRGQ